MYLNGILVFINAIILSVSQNFDNLIGYKDFTYCGYSKKYVHLSFDDGPNKNLHGEADTLKVLDILDELDVKASFFLVGKNVNMYPYIAQEIVKRGHTAASHSWTHRDLTNMTKEEALNEFVVTSSLFKDILGFTPKYYRPPYGNINKKLIELINLQTKMNLVMWNMDLNDWRIVQEKDSTKWDYVQVEYLRKVLLSSMLFNNNNPSSMIVLAHDIRSTQEMIKNVVNYIKSMGYIFVDIDTCYNNWIVDNKPESPCLNDIYNISKGDINVYNNCEQLSSGLKLSCIPNGINCILDQCGSPGCGLKCDNRNLCVNGTIHCIPNCLNKMCGDDDCGNSCGMCGTECKNGICIQPVLPDISKINLCRPNISGDIELKNYKVISLSYEITAQWDRGLVIIYTVKNNYKSIEKFKLKICNNKSTKFLNVYGANIENNFDDCIELNLEYIGQDKEVKFTLELSNKSNDPMELSCVPLKFEISCIQIHNMCIGFVTNKSFKININILNYIIPLIFIIFNINI